MTFSILEVSSRCFNINMVYFFVVSATLNIKWTLKENTGSFVKYLLLTITNTLQKILYIKVQTYEVYISIKV